MKEDTGYSSKELSPTTWPDFETLFRKHNGVCGGCWCLYYHGTESFTHKDHRPENKRVKKALVKKGQAHGIIVYSGASPVGWCQYGPRPELPRLDASKTYRNLELADHGEKLWRITCFFVDRNNRRRGIARFGLNAALASIKKKGGGTVEAYPSTTLGLGPGQMWSGTVSMFESAGFKIVSQLSKSRVVMRRTV